MNSETKKIFWEKLKLFIQDKGIISLNSVANIVEDLGEIEYVSEMKEYIRINHLEKLFVLECPFCHHQLGNENSFNDHSDYTCPYCFNDFEIDFHTQSKLFFSPKYTSILH